MLLSLYSIASAPDAATLIKGALAAPLSGSLFSSQKINWQSSDTLRGNRFAYSSKDYLFVWNSSGSTARSFTIKSAPEPQFSRLGDFTKTLQPGEFWDFGPITKIGWAQPDGFIYVVADSTDVQFFAATFA